MKYIPVAGTHGWRNGWTNDDSLFGHMMAAEGFTSSRAGDRVYQWSGALDGLLGQDLDWQAASDSLYYFSRDMDYADRNYIAHSHGGNIVLILAASKFPIRTLTTVGTPPREGPEFSHAEDYIGLHQHIYDLRRDLWGWLGQIGPSQLHLERSYSDKRVINIPIGGIDHAGVLRDPKYIPLWQTQGWLETIRRQPLTLLAPVPKVAAAIDLPVPTKGLVT